MREPGYYWVCIDKRDGANDWVIALWSGKYWHFTDKDVTDGELPEVDERRIVRDESKLLMTMDKMNKRREVLKQRMINVLNEYAKIRFC